MSRGALSAHTSVMSGDTAAVGGVERPASGEGSRRPVTGYPFLDAVLDQAGSVLAFAHRGGVGQFYRHF